MDEWIWHFAIGIYLSDHINPEQQGAHDDHSLQ
jgi:hypothetical protein